MVIDKTTGKGCAWSIASRSIAKRLIDEGIIGKQFARKPFKSSYHLLKAEKFSDSRVIITWRRGSGSEDEELWTPSFIEAGIWERGASRFRPLEQLDMNVENYLLPEMGEYLQSVPDVELVSMTRDFLIEHGVINVPITQREGNTYYFNENEVYSLDAKSELFPYEKRIKFSLFNADRESCFNLNVWRKAASQFEVGLTLGECISIFLKTELVHGVPQDQSPLDRLVQSISPPIYERIPENQDETTFDHIRMTVGLPRYKFDSWEALQDEVKKYQREIYQQVIQKLENDRQFKRYGVPINFIKLSDVIFRRDFSIEFILELKGQSTPLPDMED